MRDFMKGQWEQLAGMMPDIEGLKDLGSSAALTLTVTVLCLVPVALIAWLAGSL